MAFTIWFGTNHKTFVPLAQAAFRGDLEIEIPPLGYIDTPNQGNALPEDVLWCADNGRFSMKEWTEVRWWGFLKRNAHRADTCAFATAPDVVHQVEIAPGKVVPVGDMKATLELSRKWFARIRELGYKVALVSQDGWDEIANEVPWDEFDALFVGGSDEHKLGPEGRRAIEAAKAHGKWVHIGRAQSDKRMRYAEEVGADSADGSFLVSGARAGGANINTPKVLSWFLDKQGVDAIIERFNFEWITVTSKSGKTTNQAIRIAQEVAA
jgi:hypothetical protein